MDRLSEEARSTPDRDERADTEEPVGATCPKLARFALGRPASLVLNDRVAVANNHRGTEGKGYLLDQQTEVKDLFHCDEGTCSTLLASMGLHRPVTGSKAEEHVWYLLGWIRSSRMDSSNSEARSRPWRSAARRGTLSVVLWAFGLATTLLLLGLWGRAVVHDETTVQASARSVVNAEVATDRIYSWIEEGVATSSNIDAAVVEQAVIDLREQPEIEAVVGAVVDQFVAALFLPDGEVATIDLAGSIEPVVPLVVAGLAAHDVVVDEATVTVALANAETIDLETGGAATVVRVVEDVRSIVSLIVVVAGITLLLTGSSAVWLSEDRLAMMRKLATRILISALSFAVLFQFGSWALDPKRGGSPIAGGGSILLESNGEVFLGAALGAAGIAGGVVWVVWRRAIRLKIARSGTAESETDTRELVSI